MKTIHPFSSSNQWTCHSCTRFEWRGTRTGNAIQESDMQCRCTITHHLNLRSFPIIILKGAFTWGYSFSCSFLGH